VLAIAIFFFIFVSVVSLICVVVSTLGKKRLPKASEIIVWLVLPFVITGLFCGLPLSIPVMSNNSQLSRFANNLYSYPLPPQTQILDKHAEVGLTGNSNHCDFIVEQTLVTSLSRQEIETYYAGLEFPPVRSEPQGGDDFWTTGLHSAVTPRVEFQEVKDNGQLVFKLSLVDYGYPPGLDFRCH
jgi:energy-coupling factor transporter transmembrane protein EcfT